MLCALSVTLEKQGQRDKALTVAADAVRIYRRLAAANPSAFERELNIALNNNITMARG
jgi:hypothetical protein